MDTLFFAVVLINVRSFSMREMYFNRINAKRYALAKYGHVDGRRIGKQDSFQLSVVAPICAMTTKICSRFLIIPTERLLIISFFCVLRALSPQAGRAAVLHRDQGRKRLAHHLR